MLLCALRKKIYMERVDSSGDTKSEDGGSKSAPDIGTVAEAVAKSPTPPPQKTPPNHPSGVTITWSDKYNEKRGYMPLKLTRNRAFDSALERFVSGEASMRQTASALISILFERDFNPNGSHWDSPCTSLSLYKKHDSGAESWDAERTSDWDWKDINAQARSHAMITMSAGRQRIQLDKYSFYCSG